MGRALAAMIERELVAVLGESADDPLPVFAEQAEEELPRRQEQVAAENGTRRQSRNGS